MGIHGITDNGIEHYQHVPVKEEKIIEQFLEEHPQVIEKDLYIIGRQVLTDDGKRVDLMGLDKNGDIVIIELKQMEKDTQLRKIGYTASREGPSLNNWLMKNKLPKGFQVLCWNCNTTKELYGLCPHKRK